MKKNLTAFMIAIMIMLFSLPISAQTTVGYAQWDSENKTLTFSGGTSVPEGAYELNTGTKTPGWNSLKSTCTKVVFEESFKYVAPTSCYEWFYHFTSLETIEGIKNLNTENVENMGYMFYNCYALTSLDLSSFNTEKVTSMIEMFCNCSALTSLDLSSFKTANVTTMSTMFYGCSKLESLDLSSFNTTNVQWMRSMFFDCSALTSLNLTSFSTANVENMSNMFQNCSGLTSLTLPSSFNTEKVTNMNSMFKNCKALESLTLSSSFNTSNVRYMSDMFYGCSKLTSLDLSKFNTANVTNMSSMFQNCSGLTSLDLSKFNTTKVTNMGYMFYGCKALTTLDLSNFNTANVTNMSYMFNNCSGLTTIYVSDDFKIGNGTDGYDMFSNCTSLLGAAPYDSDKTDKNMANFDGYFTPKIITPYVNWDANTKVLTFKVANTKEEGAYDLNEGENEPKWVSEVYSDCEEVVFTPSFNHAKPTSCYMWFYGFSRLTTIQGIENLNTEKVTDMNSMFGGCTVLKSLDLSSFNTVNVTGMRFMFSYCKWLTSLNVSKFNTEKVTDMGAMFGDCSKLSSLDLSSFNTDEVTDMGYMFGGCSKLSSLDLSSFNTDEVTDMGYMFGGCGELKTIYVSDGFTTDHNPSGSSMFSDCTSLVGAAPYDSNNTGIDMANYKTGYFKTYYQQGDTKTELFGETLSVESLDLSGDKDFVAHAPFTANTVSYARDLSTSESTWFSLCLPFAYTPSNFTAYKLNSAKDDAVELVQITGEIAAGTPVLFKFNGEDKTISISQSKATIEKSPAAGSSVTGTDGDTYQLCGTYQEKTFAKDADENAFILLNNKLMNPAKMWENTNVTKVSVKPFRAYMTSTASSLESSARAFSIGFGEDEEGTTAIDQLNTIATDDAEYYDINGSRISGPVKGLNIVRRGNKTMKLIIK